MFHATRAICPNIIFIIPLHCERENIERQVAHRLTRLNFITGCDLSSVPQSVLMLRPRTAPANGFVAYTGKPQNRH
jgi:hypothetical protein